jgi:hypothetical protein
MLTGEMTPTACEDEDRELRRQAILGMAHYRSARAFAVNAQHAAALARRRGSQGHQGQEATLRLVVADA